MDVEDEVRRATQLLTRVMAAVGVTRKDLDLRLGFGPGYMSQVLTGRMELKYRHVLAILEGLKLDPHRFFTTLYPGEGRVWVPETEEALGLVSRMGTLAHEPKGVGLLEFLGQIVRDELGKAAGDRDRKENP